MTTTTPTTALADLDTLTRYGWSEAYIGEESQLIEDPIGTYVRFEDVQALARRAAQPVAPVQDVLTIPTAIMNIACKRTMSHFAKHDDLLHYKEGHRDALHAAADLVLARADELKALAPSPQIAEAAELPLLPEPRAIRAGSSFPKVYAQAYTADQLQQYARDAISASRSAAGGGVVYSYRMKMADGSMTNWQDCTPEHAAHVQQSEFRDGFEVRRLYATTAPASAGQAAPAMIEQYDGPWPTVEMTVAGKRMLEKQTSIEHIKKYSAGIANSIYEAMHAASPVGIAAQPAEGDAPAWGKCQVFKPAEGAGQAGQVAHIATVVKGNLCNRLEWVSDEAMDTPVGTKLFAERAAAPADQQQIEWSNDLQGRLIDLSQDMAESEDARQVMAEAACLLAALTGHAVSQ